MTYARIIPNIDTDTDLRPVVLTEQALHMMRPTKKNKSVVQGISEKDIRW